MCVPTYQGASYLDACMASIAAQDLDGVEVLVVDDGSTDGSPEIAASWADRIERLRVVRNEVRLGAVANVNRCVALARGRWIKPVFQDDLLEPGCLVTLRSARRRGVPVVVCARNYLYEDGVADWRRQACDHLLAQALDQRFGGGFVEGARVAEVAVEMVASRVPQLNFVGEPVAFMFDRRAARRAGGFDTGYAQLWDYELILRLAVKRGVVVVDQRLATFRVHEGSETARNLSGTAFRTNVLDRLRLHVAYATARRYRPVVEAARRQQPPVDLTALAVGVADAAHRLAEELPDDERPEAARLVAGVTRPLPTRFPRAWSGEEAATDAATALFLEHTREPPPLPTDEPAPAAATPVAPARRPRRVSRVSRVAHALRTNQWWGHMLGPIVAFAYLQLGWRQVPPGEGIGRVLALLASAIALAGYGYVVNDTADVDADRRAGKSNAMAKLPFAARLAVVAMFAALGAVPWLFISLEGPALAALAGIYLVPLLYSPPPVRLKERSVLGPLADATNAFLLPALFTVALFAPLGSPTGPAAMMIVGAVLWAVGFGLRAILIHQIADAANDQASGPVTLVGRIGAPRAIKVMRAFLFPLELAGAALLTATVATWSWGAVAAGLLYAAAFHAARLSGVIDRGLATTTLDRGWFMYWYQIWPALLLSVALAVSDPWYVLLVGLVALLFWPRVRSGLGIFRREALRELRRHGVLGKAAGPGRA